MSPFLLKPLAAYAGILIGFLGTSHILGIMVDKAFTEIPAIVDRGEEVVRLRGFDTIHLDEHMKLVIRCQRDGTPHYTIRSKVSDSEWTEADTRKAAMTLGVILAEIDIRAERKAMGKWRKLPTAAITFTLVMLPIVRLILTTP